MKVRRDHCSTPYGGLRLGILGYPANRLGSRVVVLDDACVLSCIDLAVFVPNSLEVNQLICWKKQWLIPKLESQGYHLQDVKGSIPP